jgi:stage IV sporulation protein FA
VIKLIKEFIKKIINKILLISIIILLVLIISRNNISFREKLKYYLYEDNLSFMFIKNFYNRYLGGTYFFDNSKTASTYMVFNPQLSYYKLEEYNEGIKLQVSDNYLIPSLESGIVIFIGTKEDYGNTIIIQGENDVDIWYCNIQNVSVKLYDYVDKGTYLGESIDNYIYLVYSRGNKILNYKNYFKN